MRSFTVPWVKSAMLVYAAMLTACVAVPLSDGPNDDLRNPKSPERLERRVLGVNDLLTLEDMGRIVESRDGEFIVFEKSPAYNKRVSFDVPRSSPGRETSEIFAFSSRSDTMASRLFEPSEGTGYWLPDSNPFSQDSARLAVYSVRDGRVSLNVFDRQSQSLTEIGIAPEINIFGTSNPVWVNESLLVFPSAVGDTLPFQISFRRYTADRYADSWKTTFKGEEPSFRDLRTPGLKDGRTGSTDDAAALVLYDAERNTTKIIAEQPHVLFLTSSTGAWMAAIRQSARLASQPAEDWGVFNRSELRLFDVSKETWVEVAPELDLFPDSVVWNEAGDKLAFFGWPAGQSVRENGAHHIFDLTCMCLKRFEHTGLELASQRERVARPEQPERAIWIGDRLAVLARPLNDRSARGQFEYYGFTAGDAAAAPSDPSWYIYENDGSWSDLTPPLASSERVPFSVFDDRLFVITQGRLQAFGLDGRVEMVNDSDTRRVVPPRQRTHAASLNVETSLYRTRGAAILENQDQQAYVFIDLEDESPFREIRTPVGDGQFRLISFLDRSRTVVFEEYRAGSRRISTSRPNGSDVLRDQYNNHLAILDVGEWRHLNYKSSVTGEDLKSCVLLPVDYQVSRSYPVVFDVYPSRTDTSCLASDANDRYRLGGDTYNDPGFDNNLLAAHGYVVVKVSTPSHLQRQDGKPFGGLTRLVEDVADALIDEGIADGDRMGLLGRSQGGAAALWVASTSNRFDAVVSTVGWADYYSHHFQIDPFHTFYHQQYPVSSRGRYAATTGPYALGVSPFEASQVYIENSPLFRAQDMSAATLLINSDMDFAISQYEQLFTALQESGKMARLLTYWGEGHILVSPANIEHMWGEVIGWYDTYLASEN